MKKKIALDLQPCCGNRSGVGNVAYELACRLHDTDDIEFHGNVFNFMGMFDLNKQLDGISMPINECRYMHYGVYRRTWRLSPVKYDSYFEKADISIFFNFAMPPKISGKSLVYVHDMTYLRYPDTMGKKNMRFITESTKYSIKHAERILTNSEFSKREISELTGMKLDKIDVIYPSLSFGMKKEQINDGTIPSRLIEEFGINNDVRYILFVSSIEPRKNIKRLLLAFDQLKREKQIVHKLILAGGKGWNNEEIFTTAYRLSCRKDIIFTGFVSSEEKEALYRNAEIFVYPSIYEGFGMPPLEAMSIGCPVITSNAASLPEACGDAAEFVDPYSVDSIAEGMHRVLTNTERRKELILKGYANLRRFSWDESADKLINVCESCL